MRKRTWYRAAVTTLTLLTSFDSAAELPARLYANAFASDYTVGQADLMLPLASDVTHNFYIDPSLAYATNNQGYADLGLGYRWVKNKAAILGWYVFGGYTRIDNNARLWVANPGVEALGSRWDVHLNGYFPMGDRHYQVDNLDIISFTGHSQISSLFQVNQYAGNGADVKLAYQLFAGSSLKGYVGSYYFLPAQTNNIWGGAAGLEYWLDEHLKIFSYYTYDSVQRSTGALGLAVELGGTHVHRSDPTVEERITDPVERYLAELGQGSRIPNQLRTTALGTRRTQPLSPLLPGNNIAFFSQTGTPNDGGNNLTLENCTFENPCGPTDFSQTGIKTLETLLPNTVMYFNGGSYPALNDAGTGPISLLAGQSVSGRSANYIQPAQGTARSTFNGAFTLGNNGNTLANIILLPTANTAAGDGIHATNATNIVITNTQAGSTSNPFNRTVNCDGTNQVLISNSTLFGTDRGIRGAGNSNVTLENSSVSINGGGGQPISLSFGNNAVLNVSNSIINAAGAGPTAIATFQFAIINVSNSQINSLATSGNVFGVSTGGGTSILIQQSTITVDGTATTGTTQGVDVASATPVTLMNTTVHVTGNSTIGVLNAGGGGTTATLTNSPVTVVGTSSGNVFGILAESASVVNTTNSNVTTTNTTGSAFALGTTTTGQIQANQGALTVTGNNLSAITNGTNIVINMGVCTLNGAPVAC